MNQHDDSSGTDELLSEQAAHWWVVLNEKSCTSADREAFLQWVRRSPERVEAFLGMSMVSSALKSPAVKWLDIPADELIRLARAPAAQVTPIFRRILPTTALPATVWWRRADVLAGVVMMIVLAAMLVVWRAATDARSYRTALGEQRSVALEDGSLVTINTSSQIEVEYSRDRRLIRLVAGEALFEVAHDQQRPFDVVIGDVIVRAVGTKFNIDYRTQQATVSVVEGTVKVIADISPAARGSAAVVEPAARTVTASQRVVLNGEQIGMPQQIEDLAPVTAWTQRQLVFENEPLAEVVAEFNRYNHRQILINSSVLNDREITGVFQANDSYPFLVFLSQIAGVHVDSTQEGHYVVTMDQQDSSGEGPKVAQ